MEIYVMRHGQTVWNAIGRIQGWSKNRLSKHGKEQVEAASKKFANVKFDVIFASPIMRTMQTANIMNQPHKLQIIKDNRLIEKKKGVFVGRLKSTLTEEEQLLRKEDPKAVGGETFEEIYERTSSFVEHLKKNFQNKTVLIVTHLSIANCIEALLRYQKFDKVEFDNLIKFKNAEVRKIEIK